MDICSDTKVREMYGEKRNDVYQKTTKLILEDIDESTAKAERKGVDPDVLNLVSCMRQDIADEMDTRQSIMEMEASGLLVYDGDELEMLDAVDMFDAVDASIDEALRAITEAGVKIRDGCGERADYATCMLAGLMRARLYLFKYRQVCACVRASAVTNGVKAPRRREDGQ